MVLSHYEQKHRQTLESIFARPDRKDIHWDDFVGLLKASGADVTERGGSMFGIRLNGRYAVFHRPHPGHVIYLSMLKRIRRYLAECDISLEAKDD
ncbi:MAG TPA: type II toxin-antitoxin system HicA family toxin [Anaerolineales bacterium]|nr:type II toxin-antitoxin system HicA family toxin [Anaerolineales bacterium]